MRLTNQESSVLNKISSSSGLWLLLFVLYSIFCDIFSSTVNISIITILQTLGIVVFLHVFLELFVFVATAPKFWGFSRYNLLCISILHFIRADRIAAFFCAPHKTVALGAALMEGVSFYISFTVIYLIVL